MAASIADMVVFNIVMVVVSVRFAGTMNIVLMIVTRGIADGIGIGARGRVSGLLVPCCDHQPNSTNQHFFRSSHILHLAVLHPNPHTPGPNS